MTPILKNNDPFQDQVLIHPIKKGLLTNGIDLYRIPEWLKLFFWPCSWIYRMIIRLRNFLYDRNLLPVHTLPVTVISIGNISVGGTGKTPAVEWLASQLLERGYRVGIISRGYRRESRDMRLVSNGKELLTGVQTAGDEPYMLALNLPRAPVLVAVNRFTGGLFLLQQFQLHFILLDDAFQHRRLSRQLDLVLLDGRLGIHQQVLPVGPFREPLSSLRRADMIWLTKSESTETFLKNRAEIEKITNAAVFKADLQVVGVFSGAGQADSSQTLAHKRILAFCGIAHPDHFRQTLIELNLTPVFFINYPDHHAYTRSDLITMMGYIREWRCDAVITTQKDFVRLPEKEIAGLHIYYVRVKLTVSEAEQALKLIIRKSAINKNILKNVSPI